MSSKNPMPSESSSCHCNDGPDKPSGLKVSVLKATLTTSPESPVTVVWPDGDPIEAHFHVTEIGRVQRDFVDCGGTVRRVVTCLLQTWIGPDTDHRLTAGKLLKAFAHAAPVLGTDDPPVEVEYEACNVVQLVLADVRNDGARFVLQLGKKHTDCLAKELCLPAGNKGGCC